MVFTSLSKEVPLTSVVISAFQSSRKKQGNERLQPISLRIFTRLPTLLPLHSPCSEFRYVRHPYILFSPKPVFSLLKEKKIQRRKYEGEVREVDKTYIEGGKEKKKK